MEIKQFSTVAKATDYTAASGRTIEYIILHYTASVSMTSTSALATCKYWNKDPTQASADFVVDEENIWQYNPDISSNYCWASGGKKYSNVGGARLFGVCRNNNSISIEMVSYRDDKNAKATAEESGWKISDKVIANCVELVNNLRKEYNIPADHVVTHFDVTGKLCPRPFLEKQKDGSWLVMNDIISKFRNDITSTSAEVNDSFTEFGNGKCSTFELCKYNGTTGMFDVVAIGNDVTKFREYEEWRTVQIAKDNYMILMSLQDNLYILRSSSIKIV